MLEIMIVVFIIGVILAIAMSSWLRQREYARSRACQENLSKIDGAKELYAMEKNLPNGVEVELSALVSEVDGYLKKTPKCPAGGEYLIQPIGTIPTCTYTGWERYDVPPHAIPVSR